MSDELAPPRESAATLSACGDWDSGWKSTTRAFDVAAADSKKSGLNGCFASCAASVGALRSRSSSRELISRLSSDGATAR